MKFVPMLFKTDMVQAILNGTKTVTRRTQGLKKVNANPDNFVLKQISDLFYFTNKFSAEQICIKSKMNVGDVIWVRETFIPPMSYGTINSYIYKTDLMPSTAKWKPSLFMPKEACRLFLECVSVTCERLHEISEDSAIKEGVIKDVDFYPGDFDKIKMWRDYTKKIHCCSDARSSYMTLWIKINNQQSWDSNPYVWVYEFKKVEKPDNFI